MPRSLFLLLCSCALLLAAADGPPELVAVQPVAPDTLAVVIDSQARLASPQEDYVARDGDAVEAWSQRQRFLKRDGRAVGMLMVHDTRWRPFDRLVGEPLDTAAAQRPATWSLAAPGAAALRPSAVHRKSRPTATARLGPWQFGHPQRHVLYLRFDQPLATGIRYELAAEGLALDRSRVEYHHDPARTTSEAVHATHLGFHPADPAKVAYVSLWMGDGGGYDYGGDLACALIDAEGREVHRATVGVFRASDQADAGREQHNQTGADVYRYRFDHVTAPGEYRVRVDGVGCSLPFRIAEDAWDPAYRTVARGFYHQRSGIALEEPHTDWTRPRCFHPEDGVEVLATTVTSTQDLKQGEVFGALAANTTGEVLTDAWGGYFDAGDWDRRTPHLTATMRQLELLTILDAALGDDGELDLPESGNGLPDLLDEARWNLDCYRRLQTAEGGIRHGIESAEHPIHGEGSWQESLTIYAFAPDAPSSYQYVQPAARCAWLLQGLGHDELAATYRESALRAMAWAELQTAGGEVHAMIEDPKRRAVADAGLRDLRAAAAIECYRLTGEERWHALFADITTLGREDGLYVWNQHDERDAAFAYATLPDGLAVDATLRGCARDGLIALAEAARAYGRETGFNWAHHNRYAHLGWGMLSAPQCLSLVRAHHLTGREDLLEALILSSQYALGANPINSTMVSGLGHRAPVNVLCFDALALDRPSPPGLVVYGPLAMADRGKDEWSLKLLAPATHPQLGAWPSTEAYFDVWLSPATNEFTIQQTMGPALYAWGYLARVPR